MLIIARLRVFSIYPTALTFFYKVCEVLKTWVFWGGFDTIICIYSQLSVRLKIFNAHSLGMCANMYVNVN